MKMRLIHIFFKISKANTTVCLIIHVLCKCFEPEIANSANQNKINFALKSNIFNFTLTKCTPSDDHRFLQVLSHFRGLKPQPWRYFFSEI